MEIRSLKVFSKAAETLNFSKVAESLFISQSSVSKYIASLEYELGYPLFIRGKKTIALTNFGEEFLPYVNEVLMAENKASDFLHNYKKNDNLYTLNIGTASSLVFSPGDMLLFKLIGSIESVKTAYENSHVKLQLYPDDDIFDMLTMGMIDIAIFSCSTKQSDILKNTEGISFISPSIQNNYLIYFKEMGNFTDIRDILPYINKLTYVDKPTPKSMALELAKSLPKSTDIIQCTNWSEMIISVLEGESCGVIPTPLVDVAKSCGLMCLQLPDICSSLNIAWKSSEEGPELQLFLDKFLEQTPCFEI